MFLGVCRSENIMTDECKRRLDGDFELLTEDNINNLKFTNSEIKKTLNKLDKKTKTYLLIRRVWSK